jgi:hypothetical protein
MENKKLSPNDLIKKFGAKLGQTNIIAVFVNSKDKQVRNYNFNHVIASVIFIENKTLKIIDEKLHKMYVNTRMDEIIGYFSDSGVDNLRIIRLSSRIKNREFIQISTHPWFGVEYMDYNHFFDPIEHPVFNSLMQNTIRFTDGKWVGTNIVFIFEGISWDFLLMIFRCNNLIVSGGTNTKRHILSPSELKLSQFILNIIPENYMTVVNSFHSDNTEPDSKGLTRALRDMTGIEMEEILEKVNWLIFKQPGKQTQSAKNKKSKSKSKFKTEGKTSENKNINIKSDDGTPDNIINNNNNNIKK